MEYKRSDDKESKNDQLDEKPTDDKIFPQLSVLLICRQASTVPLHVQREDITKDEQLGHPSGSNDGEALAVHPANQTSEHHVDRGSVEDGCEQDETALDRVGCDFIGVIVRKDAGAVADNLNWWKEGRQQEEMLIQFLMWDC